ncbi:MAG: phosphoribosylglycinamide formyltransferase [Nitrososphaerales archaeon]|nr:phosphoribosylglycinamide formyltransferase [Nitrososphaerales archaeon]
MLKRLTLGVLASGRGSNFQSIVDHIRLGVLENVRINVLICNNKDAHALKIAEQNGIESKFMDHRNKEREVFDRDVIGVLKDHDVDLVVLSGFMRVLSPYFIDKFEHRIMNIHPALLPSFPGLHAQRQAIDYGVKVSGCTIQYVSKGVDIGPIILQHAVHVREDDTEETLSDRILIFEHRLYPKAIQLHADERLRIEGRRVSIDYSSDWEERWSERQRVYIEYQKEIWEKEGKPLDKVLR